MAEPNDRLADWLLAAWSIAAGAAFIASPLELFPAGRYVYTVVLAACIVSLTLRVLKRVGKKG